MDLGHSCSYVFNWNEMDRIHLSCIGLKLHFDRSEPTPMHIKGIEINWTIEGTELNKIEVNIIEPWIQFHWIEWALLN